MYYALVAIYFWFVGAMFVTGRTVGKLSFLAAIIDSSFWPIGLFFLMLNSIKSK